MKYNFDTTPDHKTNASFRWGMADMPSDVIGMGTADLDYYCAPCIRETLLPIAEENCYNYRQHTDAYYDAVTGWYKRNYGLTVEREWLSNVPSTVGAIRMALSIFAKPGDTVIAQTPLFGPIKNAVEGADQQLIENPLKPVDGHYEIDFEDFERKIEENNVKLFILCSPHNPAGRVWKKEELKRLFEICKEHQVYIISDEIHQDLVFGEHKHIPSLSVGDYDKIMVSIVAASKTFNIAGAQNSMVIIPDEELQEKWDTYVKGNRVLGGNAFGYVAAEAAYAGGGEWLQSVLTQINENYHYLKTELEQNLPEAVVTPLEGTYLCWINLGAYVKAEDMKEIIQKKCHLAVDFGDWFGGEHFGTFIRMNLATSRENVEIGVNALIQNLMKK